MINIYVINLNERTDRLKRIRQDFKNFKNFNLIRVNAVRHTNGHIRYLLSHQKCIQLAKEKNLKKIIVIEDDCQSINDFENRLNKINDFENRLNKINDFLDHFDDWNIFIGGVNYTDVNNIIRKIDIKIDCLFEINYGTMTHFMIYNQKIYDVILMM